jgi:hypothetical protein
MSASGKLKIEISKLPRDQYATLINFHDLEPGLVSVTDLDGVIDEVCDDRLAFARAFLEFARQIHSLAVPSTTEMIARNVVSRCYYAAHHAIRAFLMFHERGDTSGHDAAIEQFAAVVTAPQP